MGFFDRVFGRTTVEAQSVAPAGEVQSVIVTPRRPLADRAALAATGLRNGMWVVKGDQVGILTGMGVDAVAEVTLTKPDGTTKMMLDENDKPTPVRAMARAEDLRQAYIEEIPDRPRQSVEVMRALGYTSRSEA